MAGNELTQTAQLVEVTRFSTDNPLADRLSGETGLPVAVVAGDSLATPVEQAYQAAHAIADVLRVQRASEEGAGTIIDDIDAVLAANEQIVSGTKQAAISEGTGE